MTKLLYDGHIRPNTVPICFFFFFFFGGGGGGCVCVVSCILDDLFLIYSKFNISRSWPTQYRYPYLRPPKTQWLCLFFVTRQSDHLFLRYSKSNSWPWKFKDRVMTKVKLHGLIQVSRSIDEFVFRFMSMRPMSSWDKTNSIFDTEKSRSRSYSRSKLWVPF